jgi:hypothetical protein
VVLILPPVLQPLTKKRVIGYGCNAVEEAEKVKAGSSITSHDTVRVDATPLCSLFRRATFVQYLMTYSLVHFGKDLSGFPYQDTSSLRECRFTVVTTAVIAVFVIVAGIGNVGRVILGTPVAVVIVGFVQSVDLDLLAASTAGFVMRIMVGFVQNVDLDLLAAGTAGLVTRIIVGFVQSVDLDVLAAGTARLVMRIIVGVVQSVDLDVFAVGTAGLVTRIIVGFVQSVDLDVFAVGTAGLVTSIIVGFVQSVDLDVLAAGTAGLVMRIIVGMVQNVGVDDRAAGTARLVIAALEVLEVFELVRHR